MFPADKMTTGALVIPENGPNAGPSKANFQKRSDRDYIRWKVFLRSKTLMKKGYELSTKFNEEVRVKVLVFDGKSWVGFQDPQWAPPKDNEVY